MWQQSTDNKIDIVYLKYSAIDDRITGLFPHTLGKVDSIRTEVSMLINITCKNVFHNRPKINLIYYK